MNERPPFPTRRDFLRQGTTAAAGAAVLSMGADRAVAAADRPVPESEPKGERIVLGLIGPGGQGTSLLRTFVRQPDVEVAYVCDVDGHRLADAAKVVEEATGRKPTAVKDLRRVLDDRRVHGVVIATPDHWHAPATILACDAGKHVYVEKPCSHNLREGRLMVDAARRNKRVVQVGTQSRSAPFVIEAVNKLHEGAIGDVLVAKAWNSQRRSEIGHRKPEQPPEWVDYDQWVGPAPLVPFQSNRFHGVWRWWYAFGTGDIGNDGVHDLDLARWGLGVENHPNTVTAMGGKYFFDDDQQFPDTYYVSYEYQVSANKRKQLVYEQRTWSPYAQEGLENGCMFYGTKGMMLLDHHGGWQTFGAKNKPLEKREGALDLAVHCRNFLECVRRSADGDGDERARPNADIAIGHFSSSLSHLGNIAVRVGRVVHLDPTAERILNDDEANGLLSRAYREGHWAAPKGA
jgi:predicted dehydrogenase